MAIIQARGWRRRMRREVEASSAGGSMLRMSSRRYRRRHLHYVKRKVFIGNSGAAK